MWSARGKSFHVPSHWKSLSLHQCACHNWFLLFPCGISMRYSKLSWRLWMWQVSPAAIQQWHVTKFRKYFMESSIFCLSSFFYHRLHLVQMAKYGETKGKRVKKKNCECWQMFVSGDSYIFSWSYLGCYVVDSKKLNQNSMVYYCPCKRCKQKARLDNWWHKTNDRKRSLPVQTK